ncbi:MAG: ribosomal protein S18-alanine N-acetyltransferase [Microthrixaceae bacterium]
MTQIATSVGSDTQPFSIAPMRRRHLRGVVAIEEVSNHKPWSIGLFLGELKMPTSRYYQVALDHHRVLGFSGLMFTGEEGHITNIAVHPDARRSGIATELMLGTMREAIARGLTQVTLEVRVTNGSAQELYRRFGFAPGGIRRNYYSEIGEDALIMWANDIDTDDYANRLDHLSTKRAGEGARRG